MVHEKSLYKVYDLLGDVGGLLDLFFILFSIVLSRFNYQLFLFESINELFQTSESFTSFSNFVSLQFSSCFGKSEQVEIIDKCEQKLEQELNINHILLKLRQLDVLITEQTKQ